MLSKYLDNPIPAQNVYMDACLAHELQIEKTKVDLEQVLEPIGRDVIPALRVLLHHEIYCQPAGASIAA